MTKQIVVGVLALQGAFIEHINFFIKATEAHNYVYDFKFIEVKTKEQLSQCHGLVIPGGESTSISLIAEATQVLDPLYELIQSDVPVWGTCAGLIFLARQIRNGKVGQKVLGGLDIEVTRNAFGRQLDSFEADLDYSSFISGVTKFNTVFIRAPVVTAILNKSSPTGASDVIYSENTYRNPAPIQVLSSIKRADQDLIVAVRQGNKLGTSFHPELSNGDYRFHKWFLDEFVIKYFETL
jgi:5'-phosphate synthase pdxT subunit